MIVLLCDCLVFWLCGFLVVWLLCGFLVALLSGVIAFGVAQFYDLSVALCPALLLCISCVIFFIWDLRIIYTMGNVAGRDRICNCPQWRSSDLPRIWLQLKQSRESTRESREWLTRR